MRCIIKNVPPQTFGIAGNRGVGFPLAGYCTTLMPVDNCYLIEEDGLIDILTEFEDQIEVTCASPAPPVFDFCYIVPQGGNGDWIVDQQFKDFINVPCETIICYLSPQPYGTTSTWVVDQQNRDYIILDCQ